MQTNNQCAITCLVRRHGLGKPLDLQLDTRATRKHDKQKLCTHARTHRQIISAQELARRLPRSLIFIFRGRLRNRRTRQLTCVYECCFGENTKLV